MAAICLTVSIVFHEGDTKEDADALWMGRREGGDGTPGCLTLGVLCICHYALESVINSLGLCEELEVSLPRRGKLQNDHETKGFSCSAQGTLRLNGQFRAT